MTGGGARSGLWLHAVDVVVIHELLEVLQVVPPLEEEGLCDEAEPRRDLQFVALGLLQHLLQLLLTHITVAFDFIGIWTQLHILWRHKNDNVTVCFFSHNMPTSGRKMHVES